jgi:hypothetical protein
MDGGSLMETLRWFIFQEYASDKPEWQLASCPICHMSKIPLRSPDMLSDYSFRCPNCSDRIYLTDVLRLHEAIDDEVGAGGILGYVSTIMDPEF